MYRFSLDNPSVIPLRPKRRASAGTLGPPTFPWCQKVGGPFRSLVRLTPQILPRFVLELVIQLRQRAERLFGDPGAIGGLVRAWDLGQILTKAGLPRARPQQVMDQQPALGIGQLLGLRLERR